MSVKCIVSKVKRYSTVHLYDVYVEYIAPREFDYRYKLFFYIEMLVFAEDNVFRQSDVFISETIY